MTPSEKKKRSQVLILIVLSAVLAAVIYWQYLLSPTLTANSELEDEIANNQDRLADIQSEMMAMPGYERDIEDTLSRISAATAELYPIMNNEDADIMLLSSMAESGLSANSLSVDSASLSTEEDAVNTGVYVITAAYEATGSYSALLSFISKVNDMPAVVISSVSGTAAEVEESAFVVGGGSAQTEVKKTPASEKNMTFEITAQVYMYQAPEIPEHFDEPDPETLEVDLGTDVDDYL